MSHVFIRYHECVIKSISDDESKITVEFETNDFVTVPVAKIGRIRGADTDVDFHAGQQVDVFYPKLDKSWWQGEIQSILGKYAKIKFASGEVHDDINLNRLRLHQESAFC